MTPGERQADTVMCAYCGTPGHPGDRFCEACGATLGAEADASSERSDNAAPHPTDDAPPDTAHNAAAPAADNAAPHPTDNAPHPTDNAPHPTGKAAPQAASNTASRPAGNAAPHRMPAAVGCARWLSSATPTLACGCGGRAGPEGYCETCGRRVDNDPAELDLVRVAAMTDRGRRRARNEDAVAIGELPGAVAGIVCDGVATAPRGDEAARAAVATGMLTLLAELTCGTAPDRATGAAFRAAAHAVAALYGPEGHGDAPSCTYVSAVVTESGVTVGWVGDSRAYWVGADDARPLTDDDSLDGQLTAAGLTVDRALLPNASALTRWMGADAGPIQARVRTLDRPSTGQLVLCSDGLSRYLTEPADLARIAGDPPIIAARRLGRLALDAGGVDNIAVAVLPYPPPPQPAHQ